MGQAAHVGGIWALLELLDEHRGALQYDFRARFQLSVDTIGEGVDWEESVNLVRILRADPSSMTAAALEGWDHPISREAAVLMDLFDLEHSSKAKKKPKPHPGRPWKQGGGEVKKHGDRAGRTREQVLALLGRNQDGTPTT